MAEAARIRKCYELCRAVLLNAAYYEGDEGWVVAEVLDYPGVLSQGRTLKSAQIMIRDALRLMAEYDIERGRSLPQPNGRARAKKAIHTESIPLRIRVHAGSNS